MYRATLGMWIEKSSKAIPGLVLLAFVLLMLSLVMSKGVTCADDSYIATAAKNLATGLGYSSTFQDPSNFKHVQFDPHISTGPTLVLPAALVIRLFGNTYWAPGLTNLMVWSGLLLLCGYRLRFYNDGIRLSGFAVMFSFLSYCIMTYHLEQWYALLGEVVAGLLIFLAIIYSVREPSVRNRFITGMFFSLAVHSKLISLLAFCVFMAFVVVSHLWGSPDELRKKIKTMVRDLALVSSGFVCPMILFELWILFVLGFDGYFHRLSDYLGFIGSSGLSNENPVSLIQIFESRSTTLLNRFGVWLPSFGIIFLYAWKMIQKDEKLMRYFIPLTLIVIVYTLWWVFFSIGWPRYYIVALLLIVITVLMPLLSSRSISSLLVYAFAVLLFFSGNWSRLSYPFKDFNGLFVPSSQMIALRKTVDRLTDLKGTLDVRVATQWWATVADMEYLMDDSLNFIGYHDQELQDMESFFLAVNTKFIDSKDRRFSELVQNSKLVYEERPYKIYECSFAAENIPFKREPKKVTNP